MSEIRIMEKPEEVSWETIHDVLQQAHQAHFDAGIVMFTTTLTAEQLEQRVQNNGKCFVAMDGDQVVGTGSFRIKRFNKWYCKGDSAELTLLGVLPSYQGRHIASDLTKIREEEIRRLGINTICGDTAAQNTPRIHIALRDHYRLVDYRYNNGHYSVEMMKWLDTCPFSETYCAFRFKTKKAFVHLKHTLRPDLKKIK